MENPLADLVGSLESAMRKSLSFEEQCGFYIALKLGVKPPAIEIASGLSRHAISQLNRAGQFLGGQIRYPRVVREYETLGHEAFIHRYLTAPMRERLELAVDAYARRERNPDLNAKGFNPLANKFCGRHEWAETSILMHVVFQIELIPDRSGFMWRDLMPFQGLPEITGDAISYNPACELQGDPARGPDRGPAARGFSTSKACFEHIKRRFNPTAKQRAEKDESMTRTGPPREYRIGMVEPNKGSHSPPKAPLLTRITRARAENEARNREWEREKEREAKDAEQQQLADRRARVEAEAERMLAEYAEREKLKDNSQST